MTRKLKKPLLLRLVEWTFTEVQKKNWENHKERYKTMLTTRIDPKKFIQEYGCLSWFNRNFGYASGEAFEQYCIAKELIETS
mgnify:CR=1 FL=1